MYDVADAAGVSHQTVSRVVNDRPNVSPQTRARVRAAMEELDYRPSGTARSLAVRRSGAVGVVSFMGPWFGPTTMLMEIEAAARRSGYDVHIVSAVGLQGQVFEAAVEGLLRRDVEGVVVIAPTDAQAAMVEGIFGRLPVVAVEGRLDGRAPFVGGDNEAGGHLAARHLMDHGHRTVAHVTGPPDWAEARQRTRGWERALREGGLEPGPQLVGDWTAESGFRAGTALLADPRLPEVSAVFVGNDPMALGLISALYHAGVEVPGRISVMGYDNTPESGWFYPALTTVEQQFDAVGAAAIEGLVSLIEGEPPRPELLVTPRLVSRSSVARMPGGLS